MIPSLSQAANYAFAAASFWGRNGKGDGRSPGLQVMLHSMRCLWQDLRRVHHILEPLEEELEEELEEQGQLASQSGADRRNGGPLSGGRGRW
jgi:hypothetical protein